jgi:MFS family permease
LGAAWFWTATGLPDLAKSRELGEVTKADRAWITSISQVHIHFLLLQGNTFLTIMRNEFLSFDNKLGALFVCPLTGYCMSRFGRRASMLWSNVPFAGACLLIGFAPSISVIYFSRFLVGAASGIYAQIVPAFVSEVAEPEFRGMLLCMFEIMVCLGTLFM